MNHVLAKYCPRIEFSSYEDFYANFRINVPDNFNFGFDVVDEWARAEPDKLALVWCDDNNDEKRLTFTQISQLSSKLANGLSAKGIGKGDVVLVMLRQRWEYWVTAVALHKLGAIIIPATTQLTAKDIIYRANAADVKAIIALDDNYVIEQINSAKDDCKSLKHLIFLDQWHKILNDAAIEFKRPCGVNATCNDDIMLIYFTSGTTGLAKMCCHNFVHPLGHILTAKYWQQVQEDKLHCSVTDSGWAKFGWGKIYGQWIAGATIFAYDALRFDPKKLLAKIEQYRITTFCVPPTMYRFMLQEDLSQFDLSSVQNFSTAGEPLNAEVTRQWQAATGKVIREGFGQSEGPVLLATFPWIQPRPGSMGKPSPLLNIKLLNDDGIAVPTGDEGNICVTGLKEAYPPGLFVGYYRDPKRTLEAVGKDYYNLHDVAWCDMDGYFTFVGRDDDVIKCSGYRISPFEVESVLIEHPAVVECAVTSAPDDVRGNVVKASVILAKCYEGTDDLRRELQEYVKTTTAPYKYPRIVEFVSELPKTIGGKIKRAKIRIEDEGGSFDE
ncbi:MAG: AMP-binding protein [Coriobacteriales bacterium]|jgi:acetyl-CoA synthetase|nr:AMP-binding protein [Coriobacteriales bacterium]